VAAHPLDEQLANTPAPWTVPGKWGPRGNWGRWGEQDKRGMLNFITPEMIVKAAGLVKQGKVYPLGEEMHGDLPRFITPSRFGVQVVIDNDGYDRVTQPGQFDPKRSQGASSFTVMHNHVGTHLDTFAHIYRENSLFNNMPPPKPVGTVHGDAASVKFMVGRGVLLDVAKYKGQDPLPVELLDHGRRSQEHGQGTERRDPEGRHPAHPHRLAQDVGSAGSRRAGRFGAHQVHAAGARRGARRAARS
jgi:hypothetical protein